MAHFFIDRPIFATVLSVFMTLIGLGALVILPILPADAYNDFKTIELVQEANGKALVRIGTAVTLEELRRWATGNGKWTLPVDTIIAE